MPPPAGPVVNCWDLYERPPCAIKYNCAGCVVRREDCPEWQETQKTISDRFCQGCPIRQCRFTYGREQCPYVRIADLRETDPCADCAIDDCDRCPAEA